MMQNTIDWQKCVLCQSTVNEPLQYPSNSKIPDVGSGYKSLAENLPKFYNLSPDLLDVDLKFLDEGSGIEDCLRKNNACWHKSCVLKYNTSKLARAEKRLSVSTVDKVRNVNPKRARSTSELLRCKQSCFFCEKSDANEVLHKVSTLSLDKKVRELAVLLQENELLAKLSSGDMVAVDALYHKSCLTTLYNKARSLENNADSKQHAEKTINGIVLAELVAYIEDKRNQGNDVSVFKLKDLTNMYTSRLQQFGYGQTTIHSTRLKNRILASVPDLQAFQQGRDILLAFNNEIGVVLGKVLNSDADDDAKHLARAAAIVRKEMSRTKLNFNSEFSPSCQEEAAPSSLKSLVQMILYGPNIQQQMEFESSQAALTIAQLLMFNSYSRQPNESAKYVRHIKDRETPLSIYLGLSLHAQMRKRDLVDSFHKLGLSISYDRVLTISTDVGNAVCRRFEEDDAIGPVQLKKDLFTTGAIDNLDHNPSSNTAKDSFHGTGISLFQNRDTNNPGKEREVTLIESGGLGQVNATKSVCTLPDWFSEVPPCVLPNTKPSVPEYHSVPADDEMFHEAKKEEYVCTVERVIANQELQDGTRCLVTWSGYHSDKQKSDASCVIPAISSLLPLFSEEAKSVAMLRHSMNVIKKLIDFLNPGQIPVITVDQPLYSVVKQIQWNWPDTYGGDQFVIIPGGLHIKMATLSTLGNWLEDSGWCNALSQAAIASPGVANGFLTGSNVKRTRHAHEVTASALFFLQHKSFCLFKADGFILQSMLFEEWCEDRSTHSPQFKFWHITLQLELLYLLFVRSLRESNFVLYIHILHKLVPWFFCS